MTVKIKDKVKCPMCEKDIWIDVSNMDDLSFTCPECKTFFKDEKGEKRMLDDSYKEWKKKFNFNKHLDEAFKQVWVDSYNYFKNKGIIYAKKH